MARFILQSSAGPCLRRSRANFLSGTFTQRRWRRLYSIQSSENAIAQLPGIDPEALSVLKTTTPKELLPPHELVFGRTFTGMHPPLLESR